MNQDFILEKPLLFMVFNRPDKTRLVFEEIKKVKPRKLYISADGPRTNVSEDKEKTRKVREIVKQIDWECDIKLFFHEKNLGCSLAGKTAWDWLFSQEEEMIFIEDDGLVSKSFFWYCQELLNKYRNSPKIAYISGENFGPKYGSSSYFFSRFGGGSYSMATWKRVYDLYEFKLETYNEIRSKKEFKRNFINYFAYKFITAKFDNFIVNGGNTYDLQMVFLVHRYNMLNIIPNINLCSNIGFDNDGTNTSVNPESEVALKFGNRQRYEISKIVHPDKIETNKKFEKDYFKTRILYDKSLILSIYKFYTNLYGYPVWKKFVKRILLFFRILKHA